ncbi:hypothetical protein ANCCAN_27578 [Ancylostoma caninum]|uniref:Uncharacterized protein n=1 Tax=Ancylostoma caninum TaxID=29170 RepID=A0A368EY69_ANCCA|nr:hypothetical protein ANCCAN_29585 [Ancylostoma caninum]RCN26694.1 hypothetical protein ANCCAN_27578 [Ancylostoma caninum]
MSLPPRKQYGFRVFVGSCIFTTITIALVLWDERQQRERRQEGVKYRLKSIQQQQNMQEYEEQRQRYEDYKKAHSL